MADNTLVRQLLIDEEGIELEAYKDTRGIWTIGIGHNLNIDQSEEERKILGTYVDPSKVTITEKDAYALFDIDVQDAIDDLHSRDPNLTFSEKELEELGETRRAIILSMVFQLGGAGFRKFKNFIASVKSRDFETAAEEMCDSLAARQTPERWKRASEAMALGYFEKYQDIPEEEPETPNITLTDISTLDLIDELKRRVVNS